MHQYIDKCINPDVPHSSKFRTHLNSNNNNKIIFFTIFYHKTKTQMNMNIK